MNRTDGGDSTGHEGKGHLGSGAGRGLRETAAAQLRAGLVAGAEVQLSRSRHYLRPHTQHPVSAAALRVCNPSSWKALFRTPTRAAKRPLHQANTPFLTADTPGVSPSSTRLTLPSLHSLSPLDQQLPLLSLRAFCPSL